LVADFPTIVEAFDPALRLKMIDVGAAQFEDLHGRFVALARKFGGQLFSFEPNPEQYRLLQKKFADCGDVHLLPMAIADGRQRELKLCRHPGGSSLFEPNLELARRYRSFGEWLEVVERISVKTVTLDSLEQIRGADFLKLDIQGAELEALMGATELLSTILVIECEVNFVQQYVAQPLFAEIELFLRRRGFMFHRFSGYGSRLLEDAAVDGDPLQPGNQWLWSDAIFVRDLAQWPSLTNEQLIKIAVYMHELYSSDDFAHHALATVDGRANSALAKSFATLTGTGGKAPP
jgi:FkbM family methyltransferase